MELRAQLLGCLTDKDPARWEALKLRLSGASAFNDAAHEWLEQVALHDLPSAKLCGEGLRYIDGGVLTIPPPRKKRPRVAPVSGETHGDPLEELLATPLEAVKGVGPKLSEKLSEAGLGSVGDLLGVFPREYLDLRNPIPVAHLKEGVEALIHVTIGKVFASRQRCFTEASDDTGTVKLNWFHTWPGMNAVIRKGARLWFWGKPTVRGGEFTFSHPNFALTRPASIIVNYPKLPGVGEKTFHNIMMAALSMLPEQYLEPLPPSLLEKNRFPPWVAARRAAHDPVSVLPPDELELALNGTHPSFLRIAYEELFFLQLALSMRNAGRPKGSRKSILREHHGAILKVLPFALTKGQERSVEEMLTDMESGVPMNRLLQGDVGSGKTAVAFIIAAHVMLTGRQVAIMAPTTILARQQFATMRGWAEQLGFKVGLLTSELTSGERESMLAMLESGHIQLLVGTQALIQERVFFADLGLVVIDEQHRFGVAQRATLREKGDQPHLIVMTATPIPRSLALTAYGDLDSSIIEGMPPGRSPAATVTCSTRAQKVAVVKRLNRFLGAGEKVFVVVPLIERGEESGRSDVASVLEYLTAELSEARAEALHGRMDVQQKATLIERFRSGECNLLVTTTVIEVGMDIPDAANIVIMEADRFGLAQLHQLRGRVGRQANATARCYLFTSKKPTRDGRERLKLITEVTDGFALAEHDLRMRGPGEMIGTRQSGALGLKNSGLFLGSSLLTWLLRAREDARELLDMDPKLSLPEHQPARRIALAKSEELLYGEEGG